MAKNNLKELTVTEGITQALLANQSGISQGTVNKICNQKRSCAPTTKYRLLNALNKLTGKSYSLDDIFPE